MKTYSEMMEFDSFLGRFKYLALRGSVGEPTFGHERWINQRFYTSRAWKNLRHRVIARDLGCDLSIFDRPINGQIYVHHMNPMTLDAIRDGDQDILNPEVLVCVSLRTHNAIHYGDETLLFTGLVERTPGDTTPWKK